MNMKDVKMFVGGLTYFIDEKDLETYFSTCGAVKSINITRDKKTKQTKCFGFVIFEDKKIISKVLQSGPHEIKGRKIDCQLAKEFPQKKDFHRELKKRKIFVGGLSKKSTDQDLMTYFSQFGKLRNAYAIRDYSGKECRGYGFVVFDEVDAANHVISLDHHLINGEIATCSRFKGKNNAKNRSEDSPPQSSPGLKNESQTNSGPRSNSKLANPYENSTSDSSSNPRNRKKSEIEKKDSKKRNKDSKKKKNQKKKNTNEDGADSRQNVNWKNKTTGDYNFGTQNKNFSGGNNNYNYIDQRSYNQIGGWGGGYWNATPQHGIYDQGYCPHPHNLPYQYGQSNRQQSFPFPPNRKSASSQSWAGYNPHWESRKEDWRSSEYGYDYINPYDKYGVEFRPRENARNMNPRPKNFNNKFGGNWDKFEQGFGSKTPYGPEKHLSGQDEHQKFKSECKLDRDGKTG